MPHETFFNLPEGKRQKILEVLLDEFAENEYNNVSISRIVERAGIAKGSFYQYFQDKKDCFLYLIQLTMDEKMTFMRQLPPLDQKLDLFGTLRWMLQAGVQFEFSNPQLAKVGYRAVFDDVPLPDETLAIIRQSGADYFRQLIQVGIEDGYIDANVDADIGAFIFNAIFINLGKHLMERFEITSDHLLKKQAQSFGEKNVQDAMNQVIDILEFGLRTRTEKTT